METKKDLILTKKELINLYQGVKRLMDTGNNELAFIMAKNISKYLDIENNKTKIFKK